MASHTSELIKNRLKLMMSNNCPFPPGTSVVAYLRDSGGDDQDLSTAQQQEKVEAWCEENSLILSKIYTDAARQGSSVDARDAFLEMIDHFREPHCSDKGIILWTLARFARNQNDSQYYKADLRRRGFIVHSLNDNIPDTPEGKVFESMIDWMNQKYIDDLSREVKRGLHHIVKEFNAIPGIPPVGFKRAQKVIGIRRDGSPHSVAYWVPDSDIIPLVKAAFKMRADGNTIGTINSKYHLFKNKSSYSTFFRNKIYIGILEYGSMTIEDFVEPTIPIEVWNKVQALNTKNRSENHPLRGFDNLNHPRRKNTRFLLSGLVFCPNCQSPLSGHVVEFGGKKRNDYYVCSGKRRHKTDCEALSIPRKQLEASVIQNISDYITNPEYLMNRDHNQALAVSTQNAEMASQANKIRHEQTDNQRRLNNLLKKIEDDPQAPASVMDRIRTLEEQIKNQERMILQLENKIANNPAIERTSAQIHELSENLLILLTSDKDSEKQAVVRLIVHHITAERIEDRIVGMVYYNSEFAEIEAPPEIKKLMPMG